jgi:hypothetical protein
MAVRTADGTRLEAVTVIADGSYSKGKNILTCEQAGTTP